MRPEDKERILTELRSRLVDHYAQAAMTGGLPLEEVVADSVYHEQRRLKASKGKGRDRKDKVFWSGVRKRLGKATDKELRTHLGNAIDRYSQEVCGNFDDRVYQMATRMLPSALGLLLNSVSPKRLITRFGDLPGIDDTVVVQGEVEHLRRLHELGTVILVPTHVSNLDSIILGYGVYRLGLPPVVYGAGLNLFSNPLMSFFMHNLGAYTVDRRKQDPVYKAVLKEYATLSLEHGYDNLFFPGGTRSRSGAVENRLKLGLVGTGIRAYINNLRRNANRPKIFVVPTTLSFQLVLEAETLVDDFLKEVGKAQYIITDDEFSRPKRVFDFLNQLLGLDSKIFMTIGRGMDPFGNVVDDDGESLDPHGRRIDTQRYVWVDGKPEESPQRDMQYTRDLGDQIAKAFMRDNVLQATHITARAALTLFRKANPRTQLLRLLRMGGVHDAVEMRALYEEVDKLLERLRSMAHQGELRLSKLVQNSDTEAVVADALMHFGIYHARRALYRRGDRIYSEDRQLLFYYHNHLEGYGLESDAGLRPALSPDRRTLGQVA